MATYFVATNGSSGNSGASGSRWDIATALSRAVSGDVVNIASGYYTTPLSPNNGGTTWQAEDPSNKPIFTGALGATTGASRPASLTGWNPVNGNGILSYGSLTSGNAHPYVYRRSGFPNSVFGVWCNHPENTTSGVTNGTPSGYYHSLWRMHQDVTNTHNGPMNPDLRIHDCGEQTTYTGELDPAGRYSKHDWQAMACWNSGGTLDIRLHSTSDPNPNNYYIVATTAGRGLDVVKKSSVTVRNIVFQHWLTTTIDAAPNFTMDGCEVTQCANNNFEVGSGSHNSVIKNSRFIGGGAWMHHGHDVIYVWNPGSNNVVFDNNYICWGAHGGLTCVGKPNDGLIVRNNIMHHAGTLFSNQYAGDGMIIENNVFRDSGFVEDVWNLKSPHPAVEFDGATNTVFRRNYIARCGWGIWVQANSGQKIQNLDIRHNTIVDTESPCVYLNSDTPANHSGNQIRRNIFYGPSGGLDFYRGDYTNPEAIIFNVMPAGGLAKYSITENVFWPNGVGGTNPLVSRGTDVGNQSTIGGAGWSGAQGNPLFANRTATDPKTGLQILTGSPAINIGTTLSGETGNDAGAYEFGSGGGGGTNPNPTLNLVTAPSPPNVVSGGTVTFNANANDRDAAGNDTTAALNYFWEFRVPSEGSDTQSGTGLDQRSFVYPDPGSKTCRVTVTDAGGLTAQSSVVVNIGTIAGGTEITSGLTATSFGVGGTDQTGQTPDKIVDGVWSTGSRGGGGGGAPGVNNWARSNLLAATQGVIVDIGRSVTLTRVQVSHYPGGGGTRNYNYTLQTSPTNLSGSYTDIGTATTTISPEFGELNFAQRTNVRYVKLVVNNATPAYDFASFWEMRLYEAAAAGNNPPTVNLTAPTTSGNAPLTVNFSTTVTDESTGTLSYAWTFGDGGTASSGTAPSHQYTTVGNYTCTVTVTDNGGLTASSSLPITVSAAAVNNAPTVNLTAVPNPATITAGQSVTFNASATDDSTAFGNLAYSWDFGDGTTATAGTISGNSRSVTKTYSTAGVYNASVTVLDNGIPTGPAKSTTKNVTVTVNTGVSNNWPLVDAWDNFNTPLNALFGPGRTLQLKHVVDGDPSARWIAALIPGQTLIGWDMGATRIVKRIRVYFDHSINGRSYNHTLQYSTDKNTWTNVPGAVGIASSIGVHFNEYVLGTAVNARYIRVLFFDSSNGCSAVWFMSASNS